MSHSCTSYVVPFCIHSFTKTNDTFMLETLSNPDLSAEDLYEYYEGIGEDEEDWPVFQELLKVKGIEFFPADETKRVTLKGWTSSYWQDDSWSPNEEEEIFGTVWRKGKHTVLVTNTDECSHVGEYDLTVSARDKDSLEAFSDDFNDADQLIKSNQVIQHWS